MHSSHAMPTFEDSELYRFQNGTTLTVRLEDITRVKCDAIVSSSPGDLKLKYGVCRAISDACGGQRFWYESSQILVRRGNKPLLPGEAVTQSSDGRPKTNGVKYVIHAIAPTEKDQGILSLLEKTVVAALVEADKKQCRTVAFPPIASGMSQIPLNTCAEAYWSAICQFINSHPSTSLRAMFIVCNDLYFLLELDEEMKRVISKTTNRANMGATAIRGGHERPSDAGLAPVHRSHAMMSGYGLGGGHHGWSSSSYGGASGGGAAGFPSNSAWASSYSSDPQTGSGRNTSDGRAAALNQNDEHLGGASGWRGGASGWRGTGGSLTTNGEPGASKAPDDDVVPEDPKCPICMDEFDNPVVLSCSHKFCKDCIDQVISTSKSHLCPTCRVPFRTAEGKQPRGGTMNVTRMNIRLPGYNNCGTIVINYSIPSGVQGPEHPHPGKPYHGTQRMAYLPDNKKGQLVERLLRKAFNQRLIFTVGQSVTSGADNTVVWNDIHHKTNTSGGSAGYGYPDPDYLDRVIEDLKAKGITE